MPLCRRAAQPFRGPGRRRDGRQGGFTVVEATVAGAVITLFLTSLFALNSNMIHLLRSASETANASQDLQTRIEQIRLANWDQITDPTWLTPNFFNKTDQSINLPGMSETLTVTAYSSATLSKAASPAFVVTHSASGAVSSNPSSLTASALTALQKGEMVQVDLQIQWPSLYRQRYRNMSTVVSQWGISK